jgi:hypothetical protein
MEIDDLYTWSDDDDFWGWDDVDGDDYYEHYERYVR